MYFTISGKGMYMHLYRSFLIYFPPQADSLFLLMRALFHKRVQHFFPEVRFYLLQKLWKISRDSGPVNKEGLFRNVVCLVQRIYFTNSEIPTPAQG